MLSQASILYDQEHDLRGENTIHPDVANIADFNEDISILSNEIASFTQEFIELDVKPKPIEEISKPDKTIEQQLIDWSNATLTDYRSIRITNMTTSWRNGLAFCAIIHRFRPDLVDFRTLSAHEIVENNEMAFSICEREFSIQRKLDPNKMLSSIVPDKLFIMMFVDQLKKHFTIIEEESPSSNDESLQNSGGSGEPDVIHANNTENEVIGDILDLKKKQLPPSPKKIRSLNPFDDSSSNASTVAETTSASVKLDCNGIKESTDTNVQKVKISDLKDRARNLITKKESSTSPEKIVMPSKSAVSSPSSKSPSSQRFTMKIVTKGSLSLAGTTTTTKKTAPTIGSSGGDVPAAKAAKAVRESTPDIVELTNNETIASSVTGNNTTGQTVVKTEEERKEDLRQRARLLIAAARKGQVSKDSVKVATSKSAAKVDVKENTHTSKLSLMSEGLRLKTRFYQFKDSKSLSKNTSKISLKKPSSIKSLRKSLSREQIEDDFMESEYVKAALLALEIEEKELNHKSDEIENQLRLLMTSNDDKTREEDLIKELFDIVNKKNMIIKRLEQVNILAKTKDLEKRQELLTKEIGELIVKDDDHVREELLLKELVDIVDKRNSLLQASHLYEQSLEQDEMEHALLNRSQDNNKEQCCLQ